MCKDGVGDGALQKNLDYACGAGADCSAILQAGSCYQPNTVKDHCNYAVNSYFQRKGQAVGSCDFAGTAAPSTVLPSMCISNVVENWKKKEKKPSFLISANVACFWYVFLRLAVCMGCDECFPVAFCRSSLWVCLPFKPEVSPFPRFLLEKFLFRIICSKFDNQSLSLTKKKENKKRKKKSQFSRVYLSHHRLPFHDTKTQKLSFLFNYFLHRQCWCFSDLVVNNVWEHDACEADLAPKGSTTALNSSASQSMLCSAQWSSLSCPWCW